MVFKKKEFSVGICLAEIGLQVNLDRSWSNINSCIMAARKNNVVLLMGPADT